MSDATPPKELWPFIPKQLDDYGFSLSIFRVYCHVSRVCQNEDHDGVCWQAVSTIAEHCGLHEDTVRPGLKTLVTLNLLAKTERDGETNEYRLVPPSQWHPSPFRKIHPPEKTGGVKKSGGTPPKLTGTLPSEKTEGHPSEKTGGKGNPIKAIPLKAIPVRLDKCAAAPAGPSLEEWLKQAERIGYAHLYGHTTEAAASWNKLEERGWVQDKSGKPIRNWEGLQQTFMRQSMGVLPRKAHWPEVFRLQREIDGQILALEAMAEAGPVDVAKLRAEMVGPLEDRLKEIGYGIVPKNTPQERERCFPPSRDEAEVLASKLHTAAEDRHGAAWWEAHGDDERWLKGEDWKKHCSKFVLDAVGRETRDRKRAVAGA